VPNIADMTTDGSFPLGCAVSATVAVAGHPLLALPAAMIAGACAGSVTALLQTKLKIPSILAGIITNTGLYTVNLAVMGFSSNVNMMRSATIFTLVQPVLGSFYKLIPAAALTTLVDKVAETAIEPEKQTMFISHSACREDAEFVASEIKARCGVKEVVISDIGPVIGSHTGVGCIAMCFLGTHR
jgi:hypothetical protein